MKNFGDKDMDGYHKNIVFLIQLNEKRIPKLREDRAAAQMELNFEGDQQVLLRANQQIERLNAKGEWLRTVDVD